MATVIRTYDLYNTTFYWLGYEIPSFQIEQNVSQSYYWVFNSSNIIGSQIDFFNTLAGKTNPGNVFTLNSTFARLPVLWQKYWWDEAMYYSHPLALSAIKIDSPDYYQLFSESVGTLYYLSRFNNLNNKQTVPYSLVIKHLLIPDLPESINSFYQTVNNLFVANISAIGPTGTDTAPNNSNLIMADTDLTRRITSNLSLTAAINNLYSGISAFLPYNTTIEGNLLTPYYWGVSANCENSIINVGIDNTTISYQKQNLTDALIAK